MKKLSAQPSQSVSKQSPTNRLEKILSTYPTVMIGGRKFLIDNIGLVVKHRRLNEPQDVPNRSQVDAVKEFLKDVPRTKVCGLHSYRFKYELEQLTDLEYFSNGSLITAVVELGIPLQFIADDDPNCMIGISKMWLRQLEKQLQQRSIEPREIAKAVEPSAKISISLSKSIEGRSKIS